MSENTERPIAATAAEGVEGARKRALAGKYAARLAILWRATGRAWAYYDAGIAAEADGDETEDEMTATAYYAEAADDFLRATKAAEGGAS